MDRPVTVRLVGRRLLWSCDVCNHQVSGMSTEAVQAAMDAHAAFVNRTKDRRDDAHFTEARMDALLAD